MDTEYTPVESRRGGKSGIKWILILFFMMALLYIAYDILTIKCLEIYSISRISAREVALSAGLGHRANYLTLNEGKIKQGINSNRYLIYLGMEKKFPDTLILYVKERAACSGVSYNGIQFILDDQGMVLERNTVLDLNSSLISVTGLDLRDIRIGNTIICRQPEQLNSYAVLMEELGLQNFISEVSAVNLADIGNIYLITKAGYTVTVGDAGHMRAKIGTVRAVIGKLQEMGKKSGMIEAGLPGIATYSPDDALNMQIH